MARLASALAIVALFAFASSPALAQSKNPKVVAQKKAPKKKPAAPRESASPPVNPAPVEREPEPTPPPAPSPAPAPAAAPAPSVKDSPPPVAPTEDESPKPISIAPMLGYATANLNLGVGIRAGYTLQNRLYVGGNFIYHLGKSEEADTLGGKVESSARAFYPGVEVGYDLPVGPVVIRPYGGIGAAFVSLSLKRGSDEQSKTDTSLALWPGCTLTYAIPRTPGFVGADARLVIITKADDPSFGMFATGGVRF